MKKKEYWYWLCNIKGIRAGIIKRLLAEFSSSEEIHRLGREVLSHKYYLKEEEASLLFDKKHEEACKRGWDELQKNHISFLTIEDEEYPQKLREVYNSPLVLYVKGCLPRKERKCLAIVGARDCSIYGRETAQYFGRELSKGGIGIVSGLARGIDGYAHKGALEGGGDTYGVLGCGINVCYPPEHKWLYDRIEKAGGILSEYGPGVKPLKVNFPARNRIISGLCDGILVVEARERSGSLITVEHGLEQGKDVFAIPGRISDPLSKGCNRLIKAGAIPITEPSDIFYYYGVNYKDFSCCVKKNENILEKEEEMVYSKLCLEPKHIGQIVEESGLSMCMTMEKLVSLDLKGYIKQPVKNYYIRSFS